MTNNPKKNKACRRVRSKIKAPYVQYIKVPYFVKGEQLIPVQTVSVSEHEEYYANGFIIRRFKVPRYFDSPQHAGVQTGGA